MGELEPPSLAEIRAARERLAGVATRTPLVRLNVDDAPAEIYLKLENLQPIGSFKLRGAGNAMADVSSSRAVGRLAPTALTCVPGDSHSPFSTGSRDAVTVQTRSAPSTASRAVPAGSTVTPKRLAAACAKART